MGGSGGKDFMKHPWKGSAAWLKNDRTPGHQMGGAAGRINKAYTFAENSLLSYDDLVGLGRIKAGSDYYGLKGGESRVGRLVEGYQDTLAGSDPIFAAYRQQVTEGMQGLENGGIPSDLRRSITEGLRDSQARRGILDSNTAAVEEVVRLMGGQEAVRAQRLNEANNYFNSVTSGALAAFMPSLQGYLGTQYQSDAFNQARKQAGMDTLLKQWDQGLDVAGTIAGVAMGKPPTPAAK